MTGGGREDEAVEEAVRRYVNYVFLYPAVGLCDYDQYHEERTRSHDECARLLGVRREVIWRMVEEEYDKRRRRYKDGVFELDKAEVNEISVEVLGKVKGWKGENHSGSQEGREREDEEDTDVVQAGV